MSSSISILADSSLNRVRDNNLKSLIDRKKLHLVLDLDNTLVHTVEIQSLTKYDRNYLQRSPCQKLISEQNLYQWGSDLKLKQGNPYLSINDNSQGWIIKLRPNVRSFLKEASTLFDLSISTLATRAYARSILDILDPQKLYFAHSQVITREDCSPLNKKGLNLVLSHERVVLVVDDTKEVWVDNAKNLIQIGRYEFFDDGNKLSNKKSWSRNWADESEKNGELARVLGELKKIHREFYKIEEGRKDYETRDVREAIDEVKKNKFKLGRCLRKEAVDEVGEYFKSLGMHNQRNRAILTSNVVM